MLENLCRYSWFDPISSCVAAGRHTAGVCRGQAPMPLTSTANVNQPCSRVSKTPLWVKPAWSPRPISLAMWLPGTAQAHSSLPHAPGKAYVASLLVRHVVLGGWTHWPDAECRHLTDWAVLLLIPQCSPLSWKARHTEQSCHHHKTSSANINACW